MKIGDYTLDDWHGNMPILRGNPRLYFESPELYDSTVKDIMQDRNEWSGRTIKLDYLTAELGVEYSTTVRVEESDVWLYLQIIYDHGINVEVDIRTFGRKNKKLRTKIIHTDTPVTVAMGLGFPWIQDRVHTRGRR